MSIIDSYKINATSLQELFWPALHFEPPRQGAARGIFYFFLNIEFFFKTISNLRTLVKYNRTQKYQQSNTTQYELLYLNHWFKDKHVDLNDVPTSAGSDIGTHQSPWFWQIIVNVVKSPYLQNYGLKSGLNNDMLCKVFSLCVITVFLQKICGKTVNKFTTPTQQCHRQRSKVGSANIPCLAISSAKLMPVAFTLTSNSPCPGLGLSFCCTLSLSKPPWPTKTRVFEVFSDAFSWLSAILETCAASGFAASFNAAILDLH